jgi:hypothetical protein
VAGLSVAGGTGQQRRLVDDVGQIRPRQAPDSHCHPTRHCSARSSTLTSAVAAPSPSRVFTCCHHGWERTRVGVADASADGPASACSLVTGATGSGARSPNSRVRSPKNRRRPPHGPSRKASPGIHGI